MVTADAIHTQTGTAQWIRDRGGHYLLTVKGNQKTLRRTLKRLPQKNVPSTSPPPGSTPLMGGGCDAPSKPSKQPSGRASPQPPRWSGSDAPLPPGTVRTRARTAALRQPLKKRALRWSTPICSLPMDQAQPETVAARVQGHWGRKSRTASTSVRDVVTGEDHHQLRTANGPEIMAALRNLTTRHHPSGPRRPSRYRLHHQIPVTTTKTRHQAHHPTNHLTRLCRPPAYGTALATSRSRAIGIYTGQSVTGRLHMRKAVSKSSHVDKVRLF